MGGPESIGSLIATIGGPLGAGPQRRRDRVAVRKTILIVGASRGLGLALAGEFCARNWQVIATSRGRSAELDKLVERYPSALEIESVDIVNLDSVRDLRRRLEDRRLDALFVNAGICRANELT